MVVFLVVNCSFPIRACVRILKRGWVPACGEVPVFICRGRCVDLTWVPHDVDQLTPSLLEVEGARIQGTESLTRFPTPS